eukprot:GEMP01084836.1.p2 GENE.GEMP01084836.1~~GEMP01084836.1.p2  ORF type:complete len:111 (+),score=11.59 GEMP01084836.1:31-333(+)
MAETKEVPDTELPSPELHFCDMSPTELNFLLETAEKALFKNEFRSFSEVAQFVKKEMDKKCTGTWHVFTGKHFGAWVTHESQHICYFNLGQASFLVFRHG